MATRSTLIAFCIFSTVVWLHFFFNFYYQNQPPIVPDPVRNPSSQNESLKYVDFPRKIWQTSPTFQAPGSESAIQSWLEKNTNYRYERITQMNDESYVREMYAHDATLRDTVLDLKDGMLRADLIQYMFLYAEGGTYTDLDTMCLKPIDSWIPQHLTRQVGLVLGIEGDCLGGDLISGFSHCVQFATWTMMVKPGHFILELITKRVVNQIHKLASEQNTSIANLKASYMDVMDTTGPGIFTSSIYKGLSVASGTNVTAQDFTGMTSPRLIGDVLILPVTAFGAGIGHSNAGTTDSEDALVHHLFAGSWKGDHPMT